MSDGGHPNAIRLDALAVGDRDDEARAHLEGCAACAAYVTSVAEGAAAFRAGEGARADDFAREVMRRHASAPTSIARRRGAWQAGAATVLALAAAVLLYVRTQRPPIATPPTTPTGAPAIDEGPVRFKGGVQLAVVVDHDGAQSRRTGVLELEPGDRIRLEIALDHRMNAAAGVLTDDGEWAELEPPTWLDPGTHYSEKSVAFHDDVPAGTLVFGDADAVVRARRTRAFDEVTTIRVRPKR